MLPINAYFKTSPRFALAPELEIELIETSRNHCVQPHLQKQATEKLLWQYAPAIAAAAAYYRQTQHVSRLSVESEEASLGLFIVAFLSVVKSFDTARQSSLAHTGLPHRLRAAARQEITFRRSPVLIEDQTIKRYHRVVNAVRDGADLAAKLSHVELSREAFTAAHEALNGRVDLDDADSVREDPQLIAVENRILAQGALLALDADERAIVRLSYGFEGAAVDDERIGIELGFSRSKVQRVRARALQAMRLSLGALEDLPLPVPTRSAVEKAA